MIYSESFVVIFLSFIIEIFNKFIIFAIDEKRRSLKQWKDPYKQLQTILKNPSNDEKVNELSIVDISTRTHKVLFYRNINALNIFFWKYRSSQIIIISIFIWNSWSPQLISWIIFGWKRSKEETSIYRKDWIFTESKRMYIIRSILQVLYSTCTNV